MRVENTESGGICRGSYLDVTYPGLYPVSNQTCELYNSNYYVRTGLCSERTMELFEDQGNCVQPIYKDRTSIYYTTRNLIVSLCNISTYLGFWPSPIDDDRNNRLTPITAINVLGGVTIPLIPPLENTKHRYPWICSLRSVGGGEPVERCEPGYTEIGRVCVEVSVLHSHWSRGLY